MRSGVKKKPNIIVVCTDQQRTDTLSCYGSSFLHTPGFDQIAKDGIRYERAYCTSAVCTPSRVSLLSGQYVSRHNVWSIGVNTGDDVSMIQHYLLDAGYKTGLIGKAHLEAYGAPKEQSNESLVGFEQGYGDWNGPYYGFQHVRLALGHVNYGMTGHFGAWLRTKFTEEEIEEFKQLKPVSNRPPFGGEAYRSKLPEQYHNSVWTVNSAIDFLDDHKDDNDPFFLFVSFQDPHHPHALPDDTKASVMADVVPAPDFVEGELDDKPPHFKLAREGKLTGSRFLCSKYPMSGQGSGYDFRQVDEQSAADGRSYYYSMVGIMDQQLQHLWKELKERGLYEETLIIVTSDHGEMLGDHGLWMKGPFHYDEVVRVPLMIKPPQGDTYEAGSVKQEMVSLVDIVPTCLKAAGIEQQDNIDGVDLLEAELSSDRAVFIETIQNWNTLVCKSVVTSDNKLTWYAGEEFGELYCKQRDPSEKKNLWDSLGHEPLKTKLVSKLLDMQVEVGKSQKARISYA